MKLLNIRLDPEDVAKVRALRAQGVKVSHLLREAIRAEHRRRAGVPRAGEVEAALAAIYTEHPIPRADERQRFDVHHRRRFRSAVRRHLRRRMGR